MLFFGKKKKSIKEEEAKAEAMEKGAEEGKASEPGLSPAQQRALQQKQQMMLRKRNDRFSAIMGRMYRLVISADLTMNSYYVEMGDSRVGTFDFPDRGYFDDMYALLARVIHADDQKKFERYFSKSSLLEYFDSDHTSVAEVFRFPVSYKNAEPEEKVVAQAEETPAKTDEEHAQEETNAQEENAAQNSQENVNAEESATVSSDEAVKENAAAEGTDTTADEGAAAKAEEEVKPQVVETVELDGTTEKVPVYDYFEVRCERVQDIPAPRVCVMLYVRRTKGMYDDGKNEWTGNLDTDGTSEMKEKVELRVQGLMARKDMLFYEYNFDDDTFTYGGNGIPDHTVKNLITAAEVNSDSFVHHDDFEALREIIEKGKDAKNSSAQLRIKINGLHNNNFSTYELYSYPILDGGVPKYIFGTLTDQKVLVKPNNKKDFLEQESENILKSFCDIIYEVDATRDIVDHVVIKNNIMKRENKPSRFTTWVETQIESGRIHQDSAEFFRTLATPGFMPKNCRSGSFVKEALIKKRGSNNTKWYEISVRPEDTEGRNFLIIGRDIDEIKQLRDNKGRVAEQMRFAEFNESVLETLAGLVEFRNVETGVHIVRVQQITRTILEDIEVRSPQYELTKKTINLYARGAILHDVGKITIPDAILNKPGRLDEAEFEVMKTHTTRGAEIIDHMWINGDEEQKAYSRDVALHHHERYDGKGYPEGLEGDQISIGAQAVAIADVFDALVSDRVYKKAKTFDEAFNMILNGECGAFNPRVLESLRTSMDKIKHIYEDKKETGDK
ncbi:MAG: HD domain-containing protein [Eubacteriales bacterium]|nr:HD domain-containing protein [Eubacteriales bacterium]